MANEARVRANYVFGKLDSDLALGATTMSSGGLSRLPVVDTTSHAAITLSDPAAGQHEIIWVTAHAASATTATILRAQEGSTARAWATGASWTLGVTARDLNIAQPLVKGDIVVGSATGPVVQSVGADGTVLNADSTAPTGTVWKKAAASVRDRRWVPGADQTSIDEYNDDTLDAAWVRVDSAGASRVTWAEAADSLTARNNGGDAGSELHGIVRPLGTAMAVGDAIVTCLTLMGPPGSAYSMGGIVLADGTTYGAGLQVITLAHNSGSVQINDCRAINNWNAQAAETGDRVTAFGAPTHTRLALVATDAWRCDVSADGHTWLNGVATQARAGFVPTHVGLFSSSWSSATAHLVSYEYLRRTSGVT